MEMERTVHQSTSLTKSLKALEAHGCKPWVTKLSIIPHTLDILTANTIHNCRILCAREYMYVDESQLNVCLVYRLHVV